MSCGFGNKSVYLHTEMEGAEVLSILLLVHSVLLTTKSKRRRKDD